MTEFQTRIPNESSGYFNAILSKITEWPILERDKSEYAIWLLVGIQAFHNRFTVNFYLIGFGGGGMTVGVTKDPSNITGIVGKNEVVGNDTDDK